MPALVAQHSHQLVAADGTTLFVSDYLLPASPLRASVVIMHGLGEHSGRYRHLAAFFNECGLSVRCYDHRGHGRSQGKRGDIINGDPLLQDAEIVIDDFAARFRLPPFLFGHSMGGLFAARFALSGVSPLRGLILSSPALGLRLSRLQMLLLDVLHAVAPSLAVPNGLPPRWLSHDPKIVAAYEADPLVHGKISARLMRSMLRSIEYCQANAGKLAVPALLLAAGDDHLVDPDGVRRFAAHVPPGMAQLHVYDALYHEIFNELDAARPLADLRAWLAAQDAL
ncbi:alpha/beta hydrolase [Massilia pseudoviolaceinigra]|uniref:alpha/beta hydrolase n=1 Tax=Massilia pseudoviolaceinigra TaxID=3057165 RepID=UPI002796C222|nr:alpha/beta hydrolase [Massilia sp. CCM 9206]MDQ1924936.1 lysophospholipase [Massilia sp. CCM 9206]